MDKLEFNKKLFCAYEDPIIWIGRYILENGQIDPAVKEYLFFSGQDALLKNGINMLIAAEVYSEAYKHIESWFYDLDIVNSNYDWLNHKTKLFTRLHMLNLPNLTYVEDFHKKYVKDSPYEMRQLRNAMVVLSNAKFYLRNYNLNHHNKISQERWLIWRDLVLYREKEIDKIKGQVEFIKEFDKLIKFNSQEKFNDIVLRDIKLTKENIELIKSDFNSILLKNNLEKSLPIMDRVRKIFKV